MDIMINQAISNNPTVYTVACVVALVLGLVVVFLYYIGLWKTLQKMGRHDFAALVPLYDRWELARGAGFGPLLATIFSAFIVIALGVLIGALTRVSYDEIGRQLFVLALLPVADLPSTLVTYFQGLLVDFYSQNTTLLLVAAVLVLLSFVAHIIVSCGVARSFGRGIGFALGLIILPFLFLFICGTSKKYIYHGPLLSSAYRANPIHDWASLVQARKDTFGSNAPLALALLGLACGICFLSVPGIVFSVLGFIRNSANKGKPLAHSKNSITVIAALLGLVVSLATLALTVMAVMTITGSGI